jgi:chromosome segregation ATPase
MAEITFAGLTFRGGKIVGILVALSTLGGGLWAGFEFYKDYLDMKEKIQSYTAPDLSHYDTQIEVLRSEISTVLEEVSLVNDVANNLSKNINDDLKDLKQDIRAIDKVVNDVEDRVKDTEREISQDLKVIEQELEDKIQKILANPLAGVK